MERHMIFIDSEYKAQDVTILMTSMQTSFGFQEPKRTTRTTSQRFLHDTQTRHGFHNHTKTKLRAINRRSGCIDDGGHRLIHNNHFNQDIMINMWLVVQQLMIHRERYLDT